MPVGALPEAQDNEYYWRDLIGLEVRNHDGASLGTVQHLIATGANDVLVVSEGPDSEETLIPFAGGFVTDVRLSEGVIEVAWDGLQ